MPTVPVLADLPTHHLLRRTARARKKAYERAYPTLKFRVVSTLRGPFGWRLERAGTRNPS